MWPVVAKGLALLLRTEVHRSGVTFRFAKVWWESYLREVEFILSN